MTVRRCKYWKRRDRLHRKHCGLWKNHLIDPLVLELSVNRFYVQRNGLQLCKTMDVELKQILTSWAAGQNSHFCHLYANCSVLLCHLLQAKCHNLWGKMRVFCKVVSVLWLAVKLLGPALWFYLPLNTSFTTLRTVHNYVSCVQKNSCQADCMYSDDDHALLIQSSMLLPKCRRRVALLRRFIDCSCLVAAARISA